MAKVIAIKFISPFRAIEIYDIKYGITDKVKWKYSDTNSSAKYKMNTSNIYYTVRDSRPYFKAYGQRHYIDDFQALDR